MGTRADFYVGRGEQAEWLGSIAWDGSEVDAQIRQCQSPEAFRHAVESFLKEREDATWPKDGWPWPWEDSQTTDYAWAFDEGKTWFSVFGKEWWPADGPEPTDEQYEALERKAAVFPNMKSKQKVTLGKRSGVLVFGVK